MRNALVKCESHMDSSHHAYHVTLCHIKASDPQTRPCETGHDRSVRSPAYIALPAPVKHSTLDSLHCAAAADGAAGHASAASPAALSPVPSVSAGTTAAPGCDAGSSSAAASAAEPSSVAPRGASAASPLAGNWSAVTQNLRVLPV